MAKNGLLIILSGPSGVGKGTLRMALMKEEGLHLFYSVSMTTRKMRVGEMEGREYYFVSNEEFDRHLQDGDFLEHADFVDHRYGTPKSKIDEKRAEGYNVLLEIDINGAEQVVKKIPEAITIFLMPPSFEALEARIRGRCTEAEPVIQKRLGKARSEMEKAKDYKYVVVNDTIDHAVEEIKNIILSQL